MNKSLKRKYDQFIKAGYQAIEALRYAKIWEEWREREWDEMSEPQIGDVRISSEPDNDLDEGNLFGDDMDTAYTNQQGRRISAKQAKQECRDLLERTGCWGVVSEYWNGREWILADRIWGCWGYENVLSPVENLYVIDHMVSAMDKAKELEALEASERITV